MNDKKTNLSLYFRGLPNIYLFKYNHKKVFYFFLTCFLLCHCEVSLDCNTLTIGLYPLNVDYCTGIPQMSHWR